MDMVQNWLQTAQTIAQQVLQLLQAEASVPHHVELKGYRDPVTEVDQRANHLILQALRTAFPEHGIHSEESAPERDEAEVVWWVDPLDGTTNFSRGLPLFGVALAALHRGVPVVGVVLDGVRGECFAAARGHGATLNGVPLRASGVETLDAAMVALEWPRDNVLRYQTWQRLGRLVPQVRGLRALGSAALGMAYVAAGRLDVYFAHTLSLWDQAASVLLIQEAGGLVLDLYGGPWTPDTRAPLVAATPALAQAVLNSWEGIA